MSLSDLVRPARRTAIVDIGANPIDGDPPYKSLLSSGLCTLIGFEPQVQALQRLNDAKGANETYLPYVIGDGGPATLHHCRAEGMTSLLKPDPLRLAAFNDFEFFGTVLRKEAVQTRRLDDIAEVTECDFLKLDIQGGELAALEGGRQKLAQCVAIQTEVSFCPIYENQPPVGAVDTALRQLGFIPHCFAELKRWPISPAVVNGNRRAPLNQLLEADLVYVRDFTRPNAMTAEQMKHLALLAHYCYRSFDLTLRMLTSLAEGNHIDAEAPARYMASVSDPVA